MLHLFPSNQHFTIEQLKAGEHASTTLNLTENERATLAFCGEWLNGAASFTINTSGSTGAPKAIAVSRQQMEASASATAAAVGLRAGMHALVCMPARFIAGRMMLVRGFVVGMEMTVVEPSSNPLAHLPPASHFDFTALTPMQMSEIVASGELRVASGIAHDSIQNFSAILLGGGPVSASLEQALQQIQSPIYHTYGMTETVSHVALRRLNGEARSEDFRALPGVILGLDDRGCLNIRAPMTDDQLLQTNDIVELHNGDSFRWLGRWDNVINSGGVKVQVEKVENAVERFGAWEIGERRFFVSGLPDERLGEMVTLVLEGAPLDATTEQKVLQRLRASLQAYEAPRNIRYAERFTYTPTGKIDRKAIVESLNRGRKTGI